MLLHYRNIHTDMPTFCVCVLVTVNNALYINKVNRRPADNAAPSGCYWMQKSVFQLLDFGSEFAHKDNVIYFRKIYHLL